MVVEAGADGAHVLALAIEARRDGEAYAVSLTENLPGTALDVRDEGRLVVDLEALRACATPPEYGRLLGEALFAGPTLAAWQRARARGRERLHVSLEVLAPELRTLRWERLCGPIGAAWDYLRCDQRTPYSLRVASQSDRAYAPPDAPRALALVTSPADLEAYGLARFDTLATLEGVRAALAPWPVDVLAFGVPGAAGPPTLEGLCDALTARAYAAVHVVCHGAYARAGGETVLYLADDDETTAATPASKLLRRLGRLGGEVGLPLLWFLAACSSAAPEAEGALGGLAARLGRELGAPAVVAMSDRVSIDTAGELCRPFYRQLRAHGLVDLALAEACSSVAERSDTIVPVLHARAVGAPLVPVDAPGQVSKDMSRETSVSVFSESPLPLALGERFVGRAGVIAGLRARLAADRPAALALVSPGGLGKTRAALELLWAHRGQFPGGVFWIDAATPARQEAGQHALLRLLRPDAPSLADLQRQGVSVAAKLGEAARAHRPGQPQLWVLDHWPEAAVGASGPGLAAVCPRWGEAAILVTSRMRPDDEGVQVVELEALDEDAGAALLTAGLPAGSMAREDAAAVVRWVGGMPLAIELLARSLDLGDLSPAELTAQARTGRVAEALTETQAVLRTAGAGAGLSPLIEGLRLSYERLSPEAQALARRIAQFGPEPLPTALVKALGQAASRPARATLAARSFVTGISGERFGSMHRVLADFLRGLCGPEEPADACAALLAGLPQDDLGEPARWAALTAIAVHGEALLQRGAAPTPALVELAGRVGLLYQLQSRFNEALKFQKIAMAMAGEALAADDPRRVAVVGNLAMTLAIVGEAHAGYALQAALLDEMSARRGLDDGVVMVMRNNLAVTLLGLGQGALAHDILADVVARRERLGPLDHDDLLRALTSLASAKAGLGDHAGARALHERAYRGLLRRHGPGDLATAIAAKGLAQAMHATGDAAAARELLVSTIAAARAAVGPEHMAVLDLREAYAVILADAGEWAAARVELGALYEALLRKLGPENPRTAHAAAHYGRSLIECGAYAEAVAVQEPALARFKARFGALHPAVRGLVEQLCDVDVAVGASARAAERMRGMIEEMRAEVGPDHPEILRLAARMALDLGRSGAFDEARAQLDAVLAATSARLGPRAAQTIDVAESAATVAVWAGDLTAAAALQARVLEDSRATLGADDVHTLIRASSLGQTLLWAGDAAAARPLLAGASAGLQRRLPGHVETLVATGNLALADLALGDLAASEPGLLAMIEAFAGHATPGNGPLLRLQAGLARLRTRQGRLDEALAVLTTALEQIVPEHGGVYTESAAIGGELAVALHAAGRWTEAALLLREALTRVARALGADHVLAVTFRLNLAVVSMRAGDVAAARAAAAEVAANFTHTGGAGHPLAATLAALQAKLDAA